MCRRRPTTGVGAAGTKTPAASDDAAPALVAAMVSPGADLMSVSALLGHQRLETTAIYTTPSQRDLEKVVEKLEQDGLH